jgi:hypothetical protein
VAGVTIYQPNQPLFLLNRNTALFSTNAAEIFDKDIKTIPVAEIPKKDIDSAVQKENMTQEREATHQQVIQLSEQMEDALAKEKEIQEDNKISGASAQQIWQSDKVDVSRSSDAKTSEQVLKDMVDTKREREDNPSMMDQMKDVAMGATHTVMQMTNDLTQTAKSTVESVKETAKEVLTPEGSLQDDSTKQDQQRERGSTGGRIRGQEPAKDAGTPEAKEIDKQKKKQSTTYAENKQNASIL